MAIYDINGTEIISETSTGTNAFWQNQDAFYWVLHLDCARKYFTVANVKAIIDAMSDAGLNQIQVHFSENEGFRLELDDMTLTTESGLTYDLSSCCGGQENPTKWYTQTDMDEIIEYAHLRGIDVVPSFDMPAHLIWLGRKALGTGAIDVTNPIHVNFLKAIAKKYAEYFHSRGCKYYSICFDEAGFSGLYTDGKFDYVVSFANTLASMLKKIGMVPRLYNDAVHYRNDFNYFISRDFQVLYWANTGATPDTLQHMGYTLLNSTIQLYWVLNSSGQGTTPETIASLDLLKGLHGGGTKRETKGAVLSIWCDYSASDSRNGDGGDSVVEAITPLIVAMGTNLMSI